MAETEIVAPDLKLTRVTLFKVGIGSFQKKGKIDLPKLTALKLSFKNTVMNDMLKTFSILRTSGDMMIKGVSYEAKDTNKAKLLEDSYINLPDSNTMTALLKQVRGVQVRLRLFDSTVEGKVLGLQTFTEAPTGKAIVPQDYVIIAFNEGAVKPVRVSEIMGIEILDSAVEKDFQFFLETIMGGSQEKNKSVTVFLEGKEPSEFLLNFLQEVPAWKTSYRLFISAPKETTSAKEKKEDSPLNAETFKRAVQIQGWAIIDNVLDEDWENVDLTLVTGLPVSFIYDSYSPAWILRPTVERKTETGVKVVQFDRSRAYLENSGLMMGGAPGGATRPAPAPAATMAAPMPKMMAKADRRMKMKEEAPQKYDMEEAEMDNLIMAADMPAEEPIAESTFEAATETEKGKGLSFKYHIKTPVNVRRNNSSLIPILQSDLEGILVCVYNESVHNKHPMHTVAFTNTSGLTLEEGPISLFMEGIFAGEAMLPFLEPSGFARIPYAVDQAVEVTKKTKNRSMNYHAVEVGRDLYKKYFTITEYTYEIQNYSEDPRQIIIEHPRDPNAELIETVDPTEKVPNFYRFNLLLAGKSKTQLDIKERRVERSYEQVDNLSAKIVDEWLKLKLISAEEHTYLMKRIELVKALSDMNVTKNQLDEKVRLIVDEQNRIRENLKALKDSTSEKNLREKYVTKFDERETELEKIEAQVQEIEANISSQQTKIHDLDVAWIKSVQERRKK
jgi:hypothetical protein